MKKRTFMAAIFVVMLFANAAIAQQIAGNWQGILKTGSQDLRLLLQMVKIRTVAGGPHCLTWVRVWTLCP
jgi:hypothetical protein